MSKKDNSEFSLISLFFIFLILSFFLYPYFFGEEGVFVEEREVVYVFDTDHSPAPIDVPDNVLEAESEILIDRRSFVDQDGYYVVQAYLRNLENIDDEVLINDMVETIRFDRHVNVIEGEVEALNGALFPQGRTLNVGGYGAGGASEKNTKFNVTILDLNFDNSFVKDQGLYFIKFKTEQPIESIYFDDVELRFDKYIISLGAEEMVL
jgi:hypothetical protein